MPFNLDAYKSKEIPPIVFPNCRHFWYDFPDGNGAHLVVWDDDIPGAVVNGKRHPAVSLKGRNVDIGFIPDGAEAARDWHWGYDMRGALKALQTLAEAKA